MSGWKGRGRKLEGRSAPWQGQRVPWLPQAQENPQSARVLHAHVRARTGERRAESGSGRQKQETQRPQTAPASALPRRAAQWPPTGGGAAEGRRRRQGFPGLPLPGSQAPGGAGPGRGGGARALGVPGFPRGRGALSAESAERSIPEPRGPRREVWAAPSPPPPAPAGARPRPARGLERASLAAQGLAAAPAEPREPRRAPAAAAGAARPQHARAGHRDRGASPALWGLRVSSGARRAGRTDAGTHRQSLSAPQLCLRRCIPPGSGWEVPSSPGGRNVL